MTSSWGVAVDIEVGVQTADTPTTCRHAGGADRQWRRGWVADKVSRVSVGYHGYSFLYLCMVEFPGTFPSLLQLAVGPLTVCSLLVKHPLTNEI